MMYQIGFDNFRRFKHLEPMRLGDITILVGANNAGKSTLVKGLLLVLDNIRSLKIIWNEIFSTPEFRFDANEYHDLRIGTFGRALYNDVLSKDEIGFTIRLSRELNFEEGMGIKQKRKADFTITIFVTGDKTTDQITGTLSRILLRDNVRGIQFEFNYDGKASIIEFLDPVSSNMKENLEGVKDTSKDNQPTKVEMRLARYIERVGVNFLVDEVKNILYSEVLPDKDIANDAKLQSRQKEKAEAFIHEHSEILTELADDLSLTIDSLSVEYIYAHSVSQNTLFNTSDKNDYMAKVIHRFYRNKIIEGTTAYTFVRKWMRAFEIGDNFKIDSYKGDAYCLQIYEGKEKMDLCDKGMGANQMMLLLLSIASIIQEYEYRTVKPLIIIEEPEQNIHPALQSRLIELITEVNKKYGFHFIIETHSEYIIRRAQVYVAQGNFKDDKDAQDNCPYTVYYFPKDKDPYLMEFRKDGKFANEFGSGFFDEAATLAFEII